MNRIPSPLPANASSGYVGQVSPEGFQTLHKNSLAREVVRLVTGEITRQIPLVSVSSLGVTFAFSLSHSAQHPTDSGPIGPTWRHNYQTRLVIDTSLVTYVSGDGQHIDFIPDGSGGWEVDTSTSTFVTHQLTNPSGTIWELESQPDGNIWRFEATALSGYPETAGRLTEIESRQGNVVTLNYTSGKLANVQEPGGRQITLTYTGELLASVTDPRSQTTLLNYDSLGYLKTVSGPEGCTISFKYNVSRQINSITDARGNETTYEYLDTRIKRVRFPEGQTITYKYLWGDEEPQELLGLINPFIDPMGSFRATRVIAPGGETTEYRFDLHGNLWRVILPSGMTKRYFWNSKQRFLYCAEGMPLFNSLDLLGPSDSHFNRYTRHTVNVRGDTIASMDATGIMSTYEYDAEGRLVSMHPGAGNTAVQGNWPGSYGLEGHILCGFDPDSSDVYKAPSYLDSNLATAVTNGDGMGGNTFVAVNDNPLNLLDPRVPLKSTDSLHRGLGFWQQSGSDALGASFEFKLNLNQTKEFNLSIYSHSADIGMRNDEPFEYYPEYGRDVEILVEDMNGSQSYRMHNNAPGIWLTFPVKGDASNGVKVTVTATGPNQRPVISALAFDPFEDRRTFYEYTDGLLSKVTNGLGEETVYSYNPDGTLASMTDARGKVTTYAYADTAKNLTAITDHDSNVTSMSYDDDGNVLNVTDANMNSTVMTYDGKNRLLTVTDPLSRLTEYDYDGNGNLLSVTDALDRVTSFTYTPNNQLATVEDELGQTIQIFYDVNGRRKSILDARGIETKFFYNEDGNLIRTELPNGEKITYSIDALNQVCAITGPNGNQSSADLANVVGAANFLTNPGAEKADPTWPTGAHDWTYSDGSRSRDMSQAASGQASLALSYEHSLVHDQVHLPEGARFVAWAKYKGGAQTLTMTTKIRDSQGTPVETEFPLTLADTGGNWVDTPVFSFDVPGDAHTTPSNLSLAEFSARIDSEGSAWIDDFQLVMLSDAIHRDMAGRTKHMTSPVGARVYYERDRLSRVVAIEDARGERVRMDYDALDRVVKITKPSGETLNFAYNEVGALSSFTDGRSKTTTFSYDNINRLTTITYHDASAESFTYDPVGNLLTYTDPKSQTKTFAYDDADRLTSITYSTDSSTVVFTYDDVDNLLTQTERNGDVVTYTYDDIDRLTGVSRTPDTGNTTPAWDYSFTYDANGNRSSSNVSGSSPYGASTTGTANVGGGHQLWRVESEDALYDDTNARYGTSRYYSGAYDSMNRPPAYWVGDTRQMAFEYDSESRRTGIEYVNGVDSEISFDIIGRPLGFRTEKDAVEMLSVDYSYDINSNRTAQVTNDDTFDYHIDEDGRLVGESINRMVALLPRDILAGDFEGLKADSESVELLDFSDTFLGDQINSDRWRTGHVALSYSTLLDPDLFLGGEIRQNDGLHFVFPKGYTNRTYKRDHPLNDNFSSYHAETYRLFAEHHRQLEGDFDIQVDFDYRADLTNSPAGIELYASLNPMAEDGFHDIARIKRFSGSYLAQGSGHSTTDTSGKLRLVRTGTEIKAYYWDSVNSVWASGTTGWFFSNFGDPVWIGIAVSSDQSSKVSCTFSNFVCLDGGDSRSDAGTYTSPVYDAGRTVTWGNLTWEETLPSGTDIELQVAFSTNEEGPWNFVGPDGTSGTKFTTSSGQSVHGSPSSRYCRYKAYLTGDGTDTPTLGTVELGFSGNLDSQLRTFAFDDAGNMTEKITKSDSSLIEETRTYNDLNEITQNQIDDGTTVTTWTFTHDDNGNMTSKSDGTDTYTYVWNEDNQLESVELNSSPVVDYVYDSGSRMLQRTQGSTTTNFHWDGWDLVREEKDDGVDVEVTNYLVPHGEILAFERDDEWFYLHGDGLSSTQLVTDDTGAQAARIVYGAWGEQLSVNESVPGGLDVRFVGGLGVRNDSASGLIYMRHRWYDYQLGRFISRDPIGLTGGSNRYVYPTNPASVTDPMGLKPAREVYNEIYDDYSGRFVKHPAHTQNGQTAYLYPGPQKGGLSFLCHLLRRISNSVDSNEDFLAVAQALFIPDSGIDPRLHGDLQRSKLQGDNYALSPGISGWHKDYREGSQDQAHHLWAFVVSAYGETQRTGSPALTNQKAYNMEWWDSVKSGDPMNWPDVHLGYLGADYGASLSWKESRCGDGRQYPSQQAYRKHWIDSLCDRLSWNSPY